MVEDFVQRWFVDSNAATFKAASREFSAAAEFEDLLETHLRELLLERLKGKPMQAGIRWPGSPFRGLESFEPEHTQVFFGRTRARNELRELLTRRIAENAASFVLLLGASGSGKSSLVKAGLLPDLKLPGIIGRVALCRHAVLRPADSAGDLIGSLAAAITSATALPELASPALSCPPARLAALLREAPEQVALPIEQGLAVAGSAAQLAEQAEARLVLVVDQLEELFTLDGLAPAHRLTFVAALEGLARSGLVWIVATMRSDFFDRLETLPALARLSTNGRYLLTPPDAAELGQIIRQPAREAGLRFEVDREGGSGLDDRLLQEAGQAAGALPLLEFTLDQLWQRRTEQGELTFAAYEELGGLEGALGRRAEEEFTKLPLDVQSALPDVLRALATAGQGTRGIVTARPALLSSFILGSPQRRLAEAFLSPRARLLVADGDNSGARVRVAHEALLSRWDRAREILVRERTDLQVRARLEENAALWSDSPPGSRDSLLLRPGLPLAQAQDLVKRRRDGMDNMVVAYVEASTDAARANERRERRRLRTVIAGFAGLVLLAGVVAVVAVHERNIAVDAGKKALSRELATSALLQLSLDPQLSVLLARESARVSPTAQAEDLMRQSLLESHVRVVLSPRTGPLSDALFSPDGKLVLTLTYGENNEKAAQFWDVDSGQSVSFGKDKLRSAAFSPDGQLVFTESEDGRAQVWEAQTHRPRVLLQGNRGEVTTTVFSQDGKFLFIASDDKTGGIWNVMTGERSPEVWKTGSVYSAAFSPDGSLLVTGEEDGKCHIWKPGTTEPFKELTGHLGILTSVTFSPDGQFLVTACKNGTFYSGPSAHNARLWKVDSWTSKWLEAPDRAYGVAFSPDSKLLATAHGDGIARVWDTNTGRVLKELRGHTQWVWSTAFSADGSLLVTSGAVDGTARVWDPNTGDLIYVLRGHTGSVGSARFSPDGESVITASSDQTARIWSDDAGRKLAELPKMRGLPRAAFSHDGRLVAAAAAENTARVWDVASGRSVVAMIGHTAPVESVNFSFDDKFLVTASEDGTARVWDSRTGRPIRKPLRHNAKINSAVFSHNGRWILTASDDATAKVWDLQTSAQIRQLPGRAPVFDAAFSPDDKLVVTAHYDHTVQLWDMDSDEPSARPLRSLIGHGQEVYSVAFDSSGDRIVTAGGSENRACLWDTKTGRVLSVLLGHAASVLTAAFSPNGEFLVTASSDHTARIWDAGTSKELVAFRGSIAGVTSAVFSPDGKQVLTANEDNNGGTVRIYAFEAGGSLKDLVELADTRMRMTRELTGEERVRFLHEVSHK
jgi:WD40 repeat protein